MTSVILLAGNRCNYPAYYVQCQIGPFCRRACKYVLSPNVWLVVHVGSDITLLLRGNGEARKRVMVRSKSTFRLSPHKCRSGEDGSVKSALCRLWTADREVLDYDVQSLNFGWNYHCIGQYENRLFGSYTFELTVSTEPRAVRDIDAP